MKRALAVLAVAFLRAADALAGVGAWTTSGPPGGNDSVLTDPNESGVLYGGSTTGVFKSMDNGAAWAPTGLTGFPASPIAVGAPGTVYAENLTVGFHGYFVTIYKTTDGGAHWDTLRVTVFEQGGSVRLAVDPFAPNTLYLLRVEKLPNVDAVGGDFSRSSDGGATWTSIAPGQLPVSAFALDPRIPGSLYATAVTGSAFPATAGAMYETADGGSSWTPRGRGPQGAVGALVVDPFSHATLYATVFPSLILGAATGAFRSDDGGGTFRAISAAYPNQVVPDPTRPNRLYLATWTEGVQSSTDGGSTWSPMNAGLPTLSIESLALDATSGFLHAAAGLAVYDLQVGALTLDASHPFTITLAATDQRTGRTGPGVATAVNDLWGYFSLPAITNDPSNPEVFVKILDGTGINGRYWFFYGGLTDLEYTLTVREDATGLTKTYTKPAGSECGGSDTAAFEP